MQRCDGKQDVNQTAVHFAKLRFEKEPEQLSEGNANDTARRSIH
jgi:hypothetical protein